MGSPHSIKKYKIKRYIKFDLYKRTLDLEPSSNIEGEAEVYLNVGSSHSIRCLVNSPQPPHHIFWYFQHQVKSKSISLFCALKYFQKISKFLLSRCPLTKTGRRSTNWGRTPPQAPSQSAGDHFTKIKVIFAL